MAFLLVGVKAVVMFKIEKRFGNDMMGGKFGGKSDGFIS